MSCLTEEDFISTIKSFKANDLTDGQSFRSFIILSSFNTGKSDFVSTHSNSIDVDGLYQIKLVDCDSLQDVQTHYFDLDLTNPTWKADNSVLNSNTVVSIIEKAMIHSSYNTIFFHRPLSGFNKPSFGFKCFNVEINPFEWKLRIGIKPCMQLSTFNAYVPAIYVKPCKDKNLTQCLVLDISNKVKHNHIESCFKYFNSSEARYTTLQGMGFTKHEIYPSFIMCIKSVVYDEIKKSYYLERDMRPNLISHDAAFSNIIDSESTQSDDLTSKRFIVRKDHDKPMRIVIWDRELAHSHKLMKKLIASENCLILANGATLDHIDLFSDEYADTSGTIGIHAATGVYKGKKYSHVDHFKLNVIARSGDWVLLRHDSQSTDRLLNIIKKDNSTKQPMTEYGLLIDTYSRSPDDPGIDYIDKCYSFCKDLCIDTDDFTISYGEDETGFWCTISHLSLPSKKCTSCGNLTKQISKNIAFKGLYVLFNHIS